MIKREFLSAVVLNPGGNKKAVLTHRLEELSLDTAFALLEGQPAKPDSGMPLTWIEWWINK